MRCFIGSIGKKNSHGCKYDLNYNTGKKEGKEGQKQYLQLMIIRYEYKAEDLSKFSKWEEGKYTRNLVHQGDHHQNNDKDALIGRGQKWSTLAPH